MLFSVLVPVYNVENYLDICLKSLANQTESDFEVIIIDDGSTDCSGSLCDKYAKNDKRFKVIHKKNEGLISARRKALQMAQGEYCVFCDSDDFLDLNALSKLKTIIIDNNPDLVIYGASVFEDDSFTDFSKPSFLEGFITNKEALYETYFTSYSINSLCMKSAKRSIIDIDRDYSSFYKCNYGEDRLQSASIFINAESIYFCPEKLYYYRFSSGMMRKYNQSYYNSYKTVNAFVKDLFFQNGINCISEYADYPLLVAAYGGTTQFKYKKHYLISELASIAEDKDFIVAYKTIKSNKYYNYLSLKQKIVLGLLHNRRYFMLKMLISLSGNH